MSTDRKKIYLLHKPTGLQYAMFTTWDDGTGPKLAQQFTEAAFRVFFQYIQDNKTASLRAEDFQVCESLESQSQPRD